MKKGKGIGIVAFLVLLIIIAVTYFSLPSVDTIEAVSSEYINKLDFEGLYFTQEHIIHEGDIIKDKLLVNEGDRIPKGFRVYDNIYSSDAGILSTHLDGYENKFSKDNVFNVKIEDIKKFTKDMKVGLKIINNSEWYIYIAVNKKEKLKKYKTYELYFNNHIYPGDLIEGEEKRMRIITCFE